MNLETVRSINNNFINVLKNDNKIKKIFYWAKEKEVFIGIRTDSLCFYYNYAKLFEVKCSRGELKIHINKSDYYNDLSKFPYELDKYKNFIDSIRKKDIVILLSDYSLEDYLFDFLNFVLKICAEYNDNIEKMYQQKMLVNNNKNSKKFFVVDLEIKFKGKKVDDTGRPDMLAYDFDNNELILIEVKNKGGAYGGKSGIIDHINKYYKVINDENCDGTLSGLRCIAYNCINIYKELGILPEYFCNFDLNRISRANGVIAFYLENYDPNKYYGALKKEALNLCVPKNLKYWKICNIKNSIESFKLDDYLKEIVTISKEIE